MNNIAIIVLDALRYDTSQNANTPNLNYIFNKYNTKWYKTYSHGTFTLPVHIALFQSGHLPSNELDSVPTEYCRKTGYRMFKIPLGWNEDKTTTYILPSSPNIIKGFHKLNYRTVGIGGVKWFHSDYETSNFWKDLYFNEFYWYPSFTEDNPSSFEEQLLFISTLNLKQQTPLLFYINIPTCHLPCRGIPTLIGQQQALEYIDKHILTLFNLLPLPCHVIIMADHGTTFLNTDKLEGHGFYHPNIITVPLSIFIMKE